MRGSVTKNCPFSVEQKMQIDLLLQGFQLALQVGDFELLLH